MRFSASDNRYCMRICDDSKCGVMGFSKRRQITIRSPAVDQAVSQLPIIPMPNPDIHPFCLGLIRLRGYNRRVIRYRLAPEMLQSLRRNLMGWFLAILVSLGVTLQVAHTHSDFAVHPECAFCHVAHGSYQPFFPPVSRFVARPVTSIVIAPLPPHAQQVSAFSLWNRPPPVTVSFS